MNPYMIQFSDEMREDNIHHVGKRGTGMAVLFCRCVVAAQNCPDTDTPIVPHGIWMFRYIEGYV